MNNLERMANLSLTGPVFNRFDPVRYAYIESLFEKASGKPDAIRERIEQKAALALAEYQKDYEDTIKETGKRVTCLSAEYPEKAPHIEALFSEGDFSAIKRLARHLEKNLPSTSIKTVTEKLGTSKTCFEITSPKDSFDDILTQQEEEVLQAVEKTFKKGGAATRKEDTLFKAFRFFKETFSKINTEQVITNAFSTRPENAGPLNSQLLVTQSLKTMNDLSPAYLNRFVSYIETLLLIEQAGQPEKATPKKKKKK